MKKKIIHNVKSGPVIAPRTVFKIITNQFTRLVITLPQTEIIRKRNCLLTFTMVKIQCSAFSPVLSYWVLVTKVYLFHK